MRYLAQISFVNNLNGSWTAPDDGEDYYGHGTHVASIAGGAGTFSTSYVNQFNIFPNYWIHGVAPGINIVSLRVLDKEGKGSDSSVIAAINWAIQNQAAYKLRILNLSIGRSFNTSYKSDPLCIAVENAWKKGLVVVVAAGNLGRDNSNRNHGYGTVTAPGNDPLVITVGATNTFGALERAEHKVASYSSKGPTGIDHILKPDLVAPGNNIYASQCLSDAKLTPCPIAATNAGNMIPDSEYATVTGGVTATAYLRLSGTSMATPVVTGTVALMLEKSPWLTPDQVKARLMRTAQRKPFTESYTAVDPASGKQFEIFHDLFTIGAGEVDVVAALNSTDTPAANLSAASPAASYDNSRKTLTITPPANSLWTSADLGGTSVMWGTNSLAADSSTTATSVMWGTGTTMGSSVMWGTNATWGTSVMWGTSATSAATATSMGVMTRGDK